MANTDVETTHNQQGDYITGIATGSDVSGIKSTGGKLFANVFATRFGNVNALEVVTSCPWSP